MKKSTKEEFISKANEVHNYKYDYSWVEYNGNKTNVKIICKEHGEFAQTPNSHLNGKGCPKCCGNAKSTKEEFISKANDVHNYKYDYSLVEYNGNKTKVKIICKEHGEFAQNPNNHLNGNGCPKCGGTERLTTEEFISKANEVHNYKYDYRWVEYNGARSKVKIICKEHGEFRQTPDNHLNGKGCPKCNSSKGELIIEKYLIKNNINYESQKRFKDCKNKRPLPFDFYLTDYNICIEYDGEQHFKSKSIWGGEEELNLIKIKDNIKTEYCEDNGIKLIRIPYWEKDNIEEILNRELGF